MATIFQLLITYEGLIYILLTLGGIFAFRWLWKSWNELRESVYGLEREFAFRRLSQALAVVLLILFLFITELISASFVASTLPSTASLKTPTLDIVNPNGSITSRALDTANNAATPTPISSSASTSGCIPNQLILTAPESGQEVLGTVNLVGTVNIPNFGFYKYEVSPQGAETWVTISAGREIVINGNIGLWDTSSLQPGDYQLRLVVVDNQGESYPPCINSVRIGAR